MSELTYKLLTQEDLPGCAETILAAFQPVSQRFGFQDDSDSAPILAQLKTLPEDKAHLYGAFLDGQQIGCFLLIEQDEEIFEISKLCVLPEFQGKGYGKAMLDVALETIRVMRGVAAVAAVIYENAPVRAWLTRVGFFEEFIGALPGAPCSICLMQKDLPPTDCGGGCDSCAGC